MYVPPAKLIFLFCIVVLVSIMIFTTPPRSRVLVREGFADASGGGDGVGVLAPGRAPGGGKRELPKLTEEQTAAIENLLKLQACYFVQALLQTLSFGMYEEKVHNNVYTEFIIRADFDKYDLQKGVTFIDLFSALFERSLTVKEFIAESMYPAAQYLLMNKKFDSRKVMDLADDTCPAVMELFDLRWTIADLVIADNLPLERYMNNTLIVASSANLQYFKTEPVQRVKEEYTAYIEYLMRLVGTVFLRTLKEVNGSVGGYNQTKHYEAFIGILKKLGFRDGDDDEAHKPCKFHHLFIAMFVYGISIADFIKLRMKLSEKLPRGVWQYVSPVLIEELSLKKLVDKAREMAIVVSEDELALKFNIDDLKGIVNIKKKMVRGLGGGLQGVKDEKLNETELEALIASVFQEIRKVPIDDVTLEILKERYKKEKMNREKLRELIKSYSAVERPFERDLVGVGHTGVYDVELVDDALKVERGGGAGGDPKFLSAALRDGSNKSTEDIIKELEDLLKKLDENGGDIGKVIDQMTNGKTCSLQSLDKEELAERLDSIKRKFSAYLNHDTNFDHKYNVWRRNHKYINATDDGKLYPEFKWAVPVRFPSICAPHERESFDPTDYQHGLFGTSLEDASRTKVGSILSETPPFY